MAKLSESPKFLHLFTYFIHELNQNTVKPAIVLKCKNFATRADVEKTKISGEASERFMSLRKLSKATLFPNNYAETKNHIFFMCRRMNEKRPLCWFMIDKRTKSIKMAEPPFNDLVYVRGEGARHLPFYAFSTPEGVYECMDLSAPIPFFENLASGKNMNPNLDRLDELKKLPEDTNPVIFYYSYE